VVVVVPTEKQRYIYTMYIYKNISPYRPPVTLWSVDQRLFLSSRYAVRGGPQEEEEDPFLYKQHCVCSSLKN
jgi:hypothetical protein